VCVCARARERARALFYACCPPRVSAGSAGVLGQRGRGAR